MDARIVKLTRQARFRASNVPASTDIDLHEYYRDTRLHIDMQVCLTYCMFMEFIPAVLHIISSATDY
jgi:hypothetical protein